MNTNIYIQPDFLESFQAVFDNEWDKLNFAFEKVMIKHNQNIKDIDTKIFVESGTYDDLRYYYEEESKETGKESKGILGSIFGAILKFFRKIKEVLFGIDTKEEISEEAPESIEVEESPEELISKGDKIIAGLKSFFKSNNGKALTALLATVAVGATVGSRIQVVRNKFSSILGSIKGFFSKSEEEIQNAEEAANNADMSPEKQNLVRKALNALRSIGSKLSVVGNKIGEIYKNRYQNNREVSIKNVKRTIPKEMIANLDKRLKALKAARKEAVDNPAGAKGGFLGFGKGKEAERLNDRMNELEAKDDRTEDEEEELKSLKARHDRAGVKVSKIDALILEIENLKDDINEEFKNNMGLVRKNITDWNKVDMYGARVSKLLSKAENIEISEFVNDMDFMDSFVNEFV